MRTGTRNPPVIRAAMPRNTRLVASVARNEWTRNPVMISPLTVPSTMPIEGRGRVRGRADMDRDPGGAAGTDAENRAGGKIEAAADDDQCQRCGDQRQRRVLVENVEQILRLRKAFDTVSHEDHQDRDDEQQRRIPQESNEIPASNRTFGSGRGGPIRCSGLAAWLSSGLEQPIQHSAIELLRRITSPMMRPPLIRYPRWDNP